MNEHQEPEEILDAELVDESTALVPTEGQPTRTERPPGFPAHIDQHTIVRPGMTPEPEPVYSERDFTISEATGKLIDEAPPENTSATYRSQRKLFRSWCHAEGRVPLPCTTATLLEYVGHLIREGKAPSTISLAISAIRTEHPDGKAPGTKEARLALRGYKTRRARAGKKERKAPGIRSHALRAMLATCDPEHPVGIRDGAALSLGWWMLARRTEVTNLDLQDITLRDDHMEVCIRFSKTDQEAKGTTEYVYADDDPLIDPVRWMRAWIALLDENGIIDGPLFRALTQTGRFQSRARATKLEDRLQGRALSDLARRRARKAKLPNWADVTAHGLRRGPANEMAELEKSEDEIEAAGRWTKGGGTVRKSYIDPSKKSSGSAMRGLLKPKDPA